MTFIIILACLCVGFLLAAIVAWRIYDRSDAVLFLFLACVLGWLSHANYVEWSENRVLDAVFDQLKTEEGFRAKAYRDTRGILHIGYGTNIEAGITQSMAALMSRSELETKLDELRELWPPLDTMPLRVQIALLDMAYQLGSHGVLGFGDMLAALQHKDYQGARAAALDSEWARETPNRAKRVARRFLR